MKTKKEMEKICDPLKQPDPFFFVFMEMERTWKWKWTQINPFFLFFRIGADGRLKKRKWKNRMVCLVEKKALRKK